MPKIVAMICVVLSKDGDILLLKRSPDKKLYPNTWALVGAAPLNGDEDMRDIAMIEMRDEIGQIGTIVKEGKQLTGADADLEYVIFTFLAVVENKEITLNHEHTEFKWVNPKDVKDFETAPRTIEVIEALLAQ